MITVIEASLTGGYVTELPSTDDSGSTDNVVPGDPPFPVDVSDLAFANRPDLAGLTFADDYLALFGMGLTTSAMPLSPGGIYFYPADILDDGDEDLLQYFGQEDTYQDSTASSEGQPF
jgi:hypothetical protein